MTESVCNCKKTEHETKLVVVTGGPGAGKTAILEAARKIFCEHIVVLPEAASILFSGGFPRHKTEASRRSAQRAIFFIQRELERMAVGEREAALVLCDRGTVDGLAYWPGTPEAFWNEVGSTKETEFARYHAVIHVRTPSEEHGYNYQNPVRTETAAEAALIDKKILAAWENHPRRFVVDSTPNFLAKMAMATEYIKAEVPECCRPNGRQSSVLR